MHAIGRPEFRRSLCGGLGEDAIERNKVGAEFQRQAAHGVNARVEIGAPFVAIGRDMEHERLQQHHARLQFVANAGQDGAVISLVAFRGGRIVGVESAPRIVDADQDRNHRGLDREKVLIESCEQVRDAVAADAAIENLQLGRRETGREPGGREEHIAGIAERMVRVGAAAGVRDAVAGEKNAVVGFEDHGKMPESWETMLLFGRNFKIQRESTEFREPN